jgi:putative transcriptional regulator
MDSWSGATGRKSILAGFEAIFAVWFTRAPESDQPAHIPLRRNLLNRMTSRLDIKEPLRYSDLESRLYMAPTITNRVKELRTARGWTQEQLAQTAQVSRQSINSIERNRYVPSLELALIFARIFACATDEIFQLEEKA